MVKVRPGGKLWPGGKERYGGNVRPDGKVQPGGNLWPGGKERSVGKVWPDGKFDVVSCFALIYHHYFMVVKFQVTPTCTG